MKKLESTERYNDIINLPHPEPRRHVRMSVENRAAQFAPFAALTGHNDAIKETARLTAARITPGADAVELLDRQLAYIAENAHRQPFVTVTYFVADRLKQGGEYRTVTAQVKKLDAVSKTLFTDKGQIPVEDITEIITDLKADE